MSTYTTVPAFRAYAQDISPLPGRVPDDDQAVDRLLQRAEGDVDRAIGGPPKAPDQARRLDPTTLPQAQADALSRATCAAALFRLRQRETILVGADDGLISAGSVQFRQIGWLPRQSPVMLEELAGSGLMQHSGTPASE
ncbi:MAG: hypothetical protein J2O48_02540 [Solirubrobacterales bacterium]|nr:hypothetical protein [Solirubrobacterales bacterium]